MGYALSAVRAICVFQQAVVRDIYRGSRACARDIPDVHALNLITYLHTAYALYTFASFLHNGSIQIDIGSFRLNLMGLVMNIQIM